MAKNYNVIILDNIVYKQRTPNSKFIKTNSRGEELERFDEIPPEIDKIVKLYEDIKENPDKYFEYEILFNNTIKINKIIYNPNITTHFKVPEFIDDLPVGCIESNVLAEELRRKIQQIDLPDSVDFLLPAAFANCIALRIFNIPKGMRTISDNCFINCSNLTHVFLQNITTINKNAFEGCSSLKNIDLSKVNYISQHCFMNCTSLKKVNLSETIKSIALGTFENCKSLTKIIIPENIKRIYNNAFAGCDNLVDIIMSNDTVYDEDAFTFKQKLNMKIKKELAEEDIER